MAPRVAEKQQRLDLDLPRSLPRALADPAQVRRIVTNLLSNAHQYTDPAGAIKVTLRAHRGGLRLAVSDTGRGMSAEDVQHAFDRFVRRDDGGAGTGLGLSIVKSLVDLQGGSIDVDSTVGVGSTFTVLLPAEAATVHPDAPAREALRGRCVLVVGRSSLRATLEADLVGLGLDHEWVTSATAASQTRQRRDFEVVLIDAGMRTPEAALRGLGGLDAGREGHVIFFRAEDDREAPAPPHVEAVPLRDAARAVLEAMMARPDPPHPRRGASSLG